MTLLLTHLAVHILSWIDSLSPQWVLRRSWQLYVFMLQVELIHNKVRTVWTSDPGTRIYCCKAWGKKKNDWLRKLKTLQEFESFSACDQTLGALKLSWLLPRTSWRSDCSCFRSSLFPALLPPCRCVLHGQNL